MIWLYGVKEPNGSQEWDGGLFCCWQRFGMQAQMTRFCCAVCRCNWIQQMLWIFGSGSTSDVMHTRFMLQPLMHPPVSNSAFYNAFQLRLGLSPRPMHAPRVRCGCGALVEPPQAHLSPTSFSTLKSAPSSPLQGLRATIFSVELGARSCNLPWCPPPLSPTARELRVQTQSPQLVTGRTSSVSSRTASFSPMSQ